MPQAVAKLEARAEKYNSEWAVRTSDIINLQKKTEGRGQGRVWTPQAMLRHAFDPSSSLAASARSAAAAARSGHTHVQKVRNSIASLSIAEMRSRIDALNTEDLDWSVIELRWDETHVEVAVPEPELAAGIPSSNFQYGFFPFMMMKGSLQWQRPGQDAPISEPLVVPPAVLARSCTTEEVQQALRAKLPMELTRVPARCGLLGILLGHDSHSANLKFVSMLINMRADGVFILSSRCAMHQVQICLKDIYALPFTSFYNELYCASHLLQGKHGSSLKQHMLAVIKARFRVRYKAPPNPVWRLYAERTLELLFYSPTPQHRADGAAGSADPEDQHSDEWLVLRRRDGVDFLDIFNDSWQNAVPDNFIYHWCGQGCSCRDEAHALERALVAWDKVVNQRKLPIASLPRWTKYQRPAKQMALAVAVHGVQVEAWRQMASGAAVPQLDEEGLGNLAADIDVAQMPNERTEVQIKTARLKKASKFFGNKEALLPMTKCLLGVVKVNDLVRKLFEESKQESIVACGSCVGPIFDLASDEHSPPLKVLDRLLGTLAEESTHWSLLRLMQGGWTPESRKHIQTIVLRLKSNIWFRLYRFYKHWPWPLAVACDSRASRAKQLEPILRLFQARPCCLDGGVAGPLAADLMSEEELLSPGRKRAFLTAFFQQAKSQTIAVEERFKRVRTSSQASSGHTQQIPTMTSNHVLGELRSVHASRLAAKGVQTGPHRGKKGKRSAKISMPQPKKMYKRKITPYNLLWSDLMARDDSGEAGESYQVKMKRVHAKAKEELKKPAVKHQYLVKARDAAAKRKRDALRQGCSDAIAVRSSDTAWAMGDQQFPLSLDLLSTRMSEAREAHKNFVDLCHERWCDEHGDTMPDTEELIEAQDARPKCGELYGLGHCKVDLGEQVIEDIIGHTTVLHSIASHRREDLLLLVCLEAVGDDDASLATLWLLRTITSLKHPEYQVYAPTLKPWSECEFLCVLTCVGCV